MGPEILRPIQTPADPTHHTPEDESGPWGKATPEANDQGAQRHIPLDAGRMLLDVSVHLLAATPSQTDAHIFSRSQQEKGGRTSVMAISLPQLTSLVVKSPQSISCPTDHLGTGTRIGGKISCDAYVSSCWHYVHHQRTSSPASDGPDQSLGGRSGPITSPVPPSSPTSESWSGDSRLLRLQHWRLLEDQFHTTPS